MAEVLHQNASHFGFDRAICLCYLWIWENIFQKGTQVVSKSKGYVVLHHRCSHFDFNPPHLALQGAEGKKLLICWLDRRSLVFFVWPSELMCLSTSFLPWWPQQRSTRQRLHRIVAGWAFCDKRPLFTPFWLETGKIRGSTGFGMIVCNCLLTLGRWRSWIRSPLRHLRCVIAL